MLKRTLRSAPAIALLAALTGSSFVAAQAPPPKGTPIAQREYRVKQVLGTKVHIQGDLAIGVVDEAQTSAAVLGHNFPDSRWYKEAYNLVKSGGVEPNENKGSYISRAFKKLGLG